ncbi:hypothetical protein Tco_0711093 [Tanacetum coccineum]
MNISSIADAMQPTFRGRLKRACNQISYLETPTRVVGLKKPYLICDYCRGPHKAEECKQNNPTEQVCLSGGDIYDDPSLMRLYQNEDVPPWGNSKKKEGEDGPEWVFRSKFEDELANFMLEKKFHTKGTGEMLDQHRKEMHEQFSQIFSTIGKCETYELKAPTFAIPTRSGVSTRDLHFLAPSQSTPANHADRATEKEMPKGAESSIIQDEEAPLQKWDDEEKQLPSIFKQIHINLPFLEAMIHMPKGAKVLKDLLSHKEKLEKAASSVKLNVVKKVSTIIQRNLPRKRETQEQVFSLPCITRDLLADCRMKLPELHLGA